VSFPEPPIRPDATPATPGRSASAAKPLAALTAAALLGGSVALGGAWALGAFDETETIVAATPITQSSSASGARGTAIDVGEIYRHSGPGVVQITSTSQGEPGTDAFGNAQPGQAQQALGSGFVIDKEGHIVTNYHVVEGASEIEVSFSNRETVKATVVGTDPSTDLALLQVEVDAQGLTPLSLADSDAVEVGDPVVAIGNPFGLERTVTSGIVSALQRQVRAPNNFTIDHVIQTDAPINPGNSGGPLLNARGQVIGVNTQIETGTGSSATGNVGIGFAVPSNTVKDVVAQILRTGRVDHAYLGISGQAVTPDVADKYNLAVKKGVVVESVTQDSGADTAGLKGGKTQVVVAGETFVLGGDIIVSFGGKRISSIEQLRDAVAAHKPGDKVKVVIYRDASKTSVTVTLGRQPASPQG
jgi:putative serine protease PepD